MTGINVIFLYSNTILRNIIKPDSKFTPTEGTYAISAANFLASCVSIKTVRTFGRRPLQVWGYFLMGVSHTLIAVFSITNIDAGVLIMICVFIFIYQNTSGPVAWVYTAETVVDAALGLCIQVLWLTVFVLTLTSESLMDSALHPAGVFLLFATFCFAGTVFAWYYICETMGLTEKEKKTLYVPGAKKAFEK